MKVILDAPNLKYLDSKIQRRIIPRAVRRTTQGARHQAVIKIGNELQARKRDIRKRIDRWSRGRQGAVDFSGWSLPLSSFSPRRVVVKTSRGKRRGVSVNVKGQRRRVPGHFLISSGGRKKVVKRKGHDKYPLKEAFTTGVSAMASNDDFMPPLAQYATDRFANEVQANLNYINI